MQTQSLLLILCCLLLPLHSHANCPTPQTDQPLRLALLIGNASYPSLSNTNQFEPLTGTENDVHNMREALSEYGFQIPSAFFLQNASRSQMLAAVSQFTACLAQHKDSVGLFFYAGHGVQGASLLALSRVEVLRRHPPHSPILLADDAIETVKVFNFRGFRQRRINNLRSKSH